MTRGASVIVPVHGSIAPVTGLLETLVEPSTRRLLERVLVVDDASPRPVDGADLPAGVDLLTRERNGGFGAAVNSGLAALGTGHALVLNSDVQLPPGFVADLLRHAAPWPRAVIGCRELRPDGSSAHAARAFPTIAHQVVEWLVPLASQRHRDVLHRAVGHDLAAERGSGMVPVDWVSGAVLLLPVAEVLARGGFDEGYVMYAEEVDLQLRLRRDGIPSLFDADLAVEHLGGASAGSARARRRRLVASRARYARLHGHPRALQAGLGLATGANLLWNLGRRAAGRDVDPWGTAREELHLVRHAEEEQRP